MNPQQALDPAYREQLLDQATRAALGYLCTRHQGWRPTSQLDVDALSVTVPTAEQHLYAIELLCARNEKRRQMQWPETTPEDPQPITAQLVQAETLIFTVADCFVLLSAAAIIMERPIDVLYPYFHERYRAHPNGRLELVEEPRKQTDSV